MIRWMMETSSALPMIAARARRIEASIRSGEAQAFEDDWFSRAHRVRLESAVLAARESGILEIPISGVLASEDMPWWYWYADTTTEQIRRTIEAADDEPKIRAILLRMQSPGGTVDGTAALARFVASRSARAGSSRPIWAWAERASSAAYWIASQTDRIVGIDTAEVGSIGVIAEHVDVSKMLEDAGINVTPLFSGAAKADLHDARPLSDEARARVQTELDALRRIFAEAVAAGRPLSVEAVLATEARGFVGAAALEAGLIDAIATIDDTRAALLATLDRPSRSTGTASAQASKSRAIPASATARKAARRPASRSHAKKPGPANSRSKIMARYRNAGCRTAAGNPTAGEALAAELNRLIDNQVTEERTREDVIGEMAAAAGIEAGTVNQILDGSINCPPIDRLEGFAGVLDVDVSELVSAAEEDGCMFEQEDEGEAAPAEDDASARGQPRPTATESDSARVLAILDLPEAKGREDSAKELARAGLSVDKAKAVLKTLPKAMAATGDRLLAALDGQPAIAVGADADAADTPADAGAAVAAACKAAGLTHLFRD